jgi:hypothetical protein
VLGFSLVACSPSTPVPNTILPTTIATTQSATPQPPTPTQPTPLVPAPTQANTPTPDPKDALLAAFTSALSKIKTYRVRVPEEGRLLEVVLPDRTRQTESEPITKIGGNYYQPNLAPGSQSVGPVPYMDRVNLLLVKDEISKSSGTSALGPATIDGTTCIGYSTNFVLYRVSPPRSPGATPVVTQLSQPVKFWIAITDGFPRRIEYGAPELVTANFFDFNATIEINPP